MDAIVGKDIIKKIIDGVKKGSIDPNKESDIISFPLNIALSLDNLEFANELLENGANPWKKNSYGASPMDIALKDGKIDFIELFQKFDTVNLKEENQCIVPPSSSKCIEDVQLLLNVYLEERTHEENGPQPVRNFIISSFDRFNLDNVKKNYRDFLDKKMIPYPLSESMLSKFLQAMKNGEVDVNELIEADEDCEFHILLACVYYNVDVTPFLEMGADPYLKNKDGVSAHSYCIEQGLIEYLDIFENCKLNTKEPSI